MHSGITIIEMLFAFLFTLAIVIFVPAAIQRVEDKNPPIDFQKIK